jgi:iron complex transport system ATP-binding protein
MLTASDVSFRVLNKALVSNISICFEPNKLHLIIGPNGAGKSTLVKLLARYLRPQTGKVEYEGMDVKVTSEAELAKVRAVLSQAIDIAFPLTVREVVMMGRYPHFGGRPGDIDLRIVDEVMEQLDVAEFSSRDYQTLSGGERQRVNFARVLAQLWHDGQADVRRSCRYLLLDEPLTFLDIRHQIDFMKKIKAFTAGSNVVTIGVVHDLNLAAHFGDQLVLLNEGRVVAHGKAVDVLTAERIYDVFGVKPTFIRSEGSSTHIVFN